MRLIALVPAALGLALAAGLPVSAITAQPFEGVIVSTVRDLDDNTTWEFTTSLKGAKARIESPSMEGTYQLVDVPAQRYILVTPGKKSYFTMDLSGMNDDANAKESIKPLGTTETIAGHSCTHYRYQNEDEIYDICAAKGLGFSVMGNQLGASGGTGGRDFQNAFKDGFQPLKMDRIIGSKREPVLLVKSIARKALPASLFEIPADFKEVKMGGPGGLL
jgi:hypothetical protein